MERWKARARRWELPTDTRGKPRVDDRRVISGIVHVLKSGARWVDAPTVYGPRKTLYNRYVRWAAKGVWVNLFHSLARAGGPSAQLLIDSSAVKAHRSASGGKGGAQSGDRPLARRTDDQDPCPDRRAVPPDCFHADGRTDGGLHGWSAAPRTAAALPHPAWRQGLRHKRHPPPDLSSTAPCRTSRPRPAGAGRTASRLPSTADETPSSACSAA